ncbi:hypothetical protein Vretimale_1569 [Volvox reticuliferus]|uniref:DUF1279 domain-containing protein n=1 Tax=Volvox reticuliferus TaxID=1737510 RepID=A0A8J4DA31_9CHLO|nr:hypothetical protein Vretifemale_10934 [Volvox reticuliferus]GIL95563.1 hypothetical protein Vretimale_1569 [Volvox reticuliferus]
MASSSLASRFNFSNLKAGLKKYGKTGIYTYLGLSTCVTASFYIAIESHVDVRSLLGIKKEDGDGKEPSFVERVLVGKGSNLALAFLCSKMLIPVKVPAAIALTPYVQRLIDKLAGRAARSARP